MAGAVVVVVVEGAEAILVVQALVLPRGAAGVGERVGYRGVTGKHHDLTLVLVVATTKKNNKYSTVPRWCRASAPPPTNDLL